VRVAICSVGSELVSGDVPDTNAVWLARRLRDSGCRVVAQLLVGDDHDTLVGALEWLATRADVLVVGGGLGPTADDVTRYAVAAFAGVALERRQDLVERLERDYRRLGRTSSAGWLRQADVPVAAHVFRPLGTAAGFSLEVPRAGGTVAVYVLPGVPWEFKGSAERDVLPDVVRRSGGQAHVVRTLHVAGVGESRINDALEPVAGRLAAAAPRPDDPDHGLELSFLAGDDEVLVKVTAAGSSPFEAARKAARLVDEVAGVLGPAVTSVDERRVEDEVVRLLETSGATVSVAESFTAGRVCALLSGSRGFPRFLRGGSVVSSADAQAALLGEQAGVLDRHGPVSRPAVEAFAAAARLRFGSDYALATVGDTGPVERGETGDEPEEAGTAMWSIARPDGTFRTEERYIRGQHAMVQARAAALALAALRTDLLANPAGR
jgi:nicotinamide-nucleotide amidase